MTVLSSISTDRPFITTGVWNLSREWAKHFGMPETDDSDPLEAAVVSGKLSGDDATEWFTAHAGYSRWDNQFDLLKAAELAEKVCFEFAMDHLTLLLSEEHHGTVKRYRCLTARPWHWQALDNLSMHLRSPLAIVTASETTVRDLVGRVYDRHMAQSGIVQTAAADASEAVEDAPNVNEALAALDNRDLLSRAGKEPVAKLVDALLYEASRKTASDLHIHPYSEYLKVRFRLDGVLHDVYQLPRQLHDQIVGRIKVLGGMDVSEKRLAQDGRTSVKIGSRHIDLRVSTLPTTCGERVVIRLLEQTMKLKELSELGMPKPVERSFRDAVNRSTGLILVTGPTGSGKSTTLYSGLAQLDATAKNILTLEDPVEYRLAGISQTQVSEKKGMTFLSGLRHIVRQDPDVIMVGEIRDEPTARMVIQSSLTGHLVLSTLHTNSAAGAVARLMDLGIEPFLIASSLIGVLAQRLVRRSCDVCLGNGTRNCRQCNGTGYSGRLALFEWFVVTPEIRAAITSGTTAQQIESLAVRSGMQTLRAQGNDLIRQGITTQMEVLRVLGTEDV